jgi:hypothetical protein
LRERKLPKAISKGWYAPAFFGLVPIPLGWLAVYGFVALVRWIMKGGFKGPKQPPADTAQQNTRR